MRFSVIVDEEDGAFGAHSPDVPNVVAVGSSVDEVLARLRLGIEALFDIIRKEGGEYPVPKTIVATVEVSDVA